MVTCLPQTEVALKINGKCFNLVLMPSKMSNEVLQGTTQCNIMKPPLHYDVCPKCPVPYPTSPAPQDFPTIQETGPWAYGFRGPKGSLFYQQLQRGGKRQAALLCNSLVRMNRFQHRMPVEMLGRE